MQTLDKRRLQHRCCPMKFEKFFYRAPPVGVSFLSYRNQQEFWSYASFLVWFFVFIFRIFLTNGSLNHETKSWTILLLRTQHYLKFFTSIFLVKIYFSLLDSQLFSCFLKRNSWYLCAIQHWIWAIQHWLTD